MHNPAVPHFYYMDSPGIQGVFLALLNLYIFKIFKRCFGFR